MGLSKNKSDGSISRRELLRNGLIFSAALLTPQFLVKASGRKARTYFESGGLHLLAMGDFGTGGTAQKRVAAQMASFAKNLNAPLNCVLALGDNFYGNVTPQRFQSVFENMYSKQHLNVPFHICFGNHDYGTAKYDFQKGKLKMQLDYAKKYPHSRWKAPQKWYTLELPDKKNPLLRLLVLDGNYNIGFLTPQEKLAQERFLKAELQRPTKARWTWFVNHYPLYTNSIREDNKALIRAWSPMLKQYKIPFILAGHDHTLQHLEIPGYQTSFVVSGAGGAGLYNVKQSARGKYVAKIFGFNHFHITNNWVDVQYIDQHGNLLHSFRRTLNGNIQII